MAKQTMATRCLDRLGIAYTVLSYDYDPAAAERGQQAAEALGLEPSRVFKTLLAKVDGRTVCVAIPVAGHLSFKKLAQQQGGKSAAMLAPVEAERLTGYKVGGISPFGQRRVSPFVLDASAGDADWLVINGGQRGLLLQLSPADAIKATSAQLADLLA
ncbi:Cys-tRNA(Pro) deacylase [Frateuria aurantia]